jgi:hypothetical protein
MTDEPQKIGYAIPEDRFPQPALPTADEAWLATVETVSAILGPTYRPIAVEAISRPLFEHLVRPLLESAKEWRQRAVAPRQAHSQLGQRIQIAREALDQSVRIPAEDQPARQQYEE